MLNRFSVKQRLFLLVSVPLLVILLLTATSLLKMKELSAGASDIYLDRVVPLKQIKQVADAYAVSSVDLLHKVRSGVLTTAKASSELKNSIQFADEVWQSYLNTTLTAEESALVKNASEQITHFKGLLQGYITQIEDGSLIERPQTVFNQELYSVVDPLSSSLAQLIEIQLVESERFKEQAEKSYNFFIKLFIGVLFVVFFVLVFLSFLIFRSIHQPLSSLQKSIVIVGDSSDLRIRADVFGQDEIAQTAQAFNQTIERVHHFFKSLLSEINELSSASLNMNQISQQVSSTAFEQEQQVNLIATAVNEMSSAIQEVAGSAQSTSVQANGMDSRAQDGYLQVQKNKASIEQLSQVVQVTSVVIEQLKLESEKISSVLATIQNIAGQTNLLALNAAIEAARAGDAGRGFAVVASEVRNLATSTQEATESIKQMIETLQQSASEAVDSMSKSGLYASESVDNAVQASRVLEELKDAVASIVDMNMQISAATEEQTVVAEDINKNINEFTLSIAEMSRNATQSADTSRNLEALAQRLHQQASLYNV